MEEIEDYFDALLEPIEGLDNVLKEVATTPPVR